MRYKIQIAILVCMLLLSKNIFSQVTLVSAFNKTGNANVTDLWNITVATNGNIEIGILKLKIVLTEGHSGQELWNSTSPVFVMSRPQQTYTYSSFNNTKAEFVNDTFKLNYQQQNILPNGDYSLCIYLINPDYETEIAFACNNFTIKNAEGAGHKRTIFDRWGIALKGGIQVITFNSWGSPNRPQYPYNYVQVYGSPSVTLFNVPVQVNMLLNFPEYKFSAQGSRFSVNYDYERYKAAIKKKATNYINEKYNVDKTANSLQGLKNEAAKLENIINNQTLLDEINKLKNFEAIEKKLKDTLPELITSYQSKLKKYAEDSINKAKAVVIDDFPHDTDSLQTTITDSLGSSLDSLGKIKLLDSLSSAQEQLDSLQKYINKKRSEIESLKKKKEYLDKMIKKYDEIKEKLSQTKDVNAILTDPKAYDQYIKNENILTVKEKILSAIRTLNIGKSVTNVSEYTLYNVPINGFTVELEPAKVYTLFSTGNIENPLNFNAGGNSSRKVTTVGLGYGKREETHFYIYYLDGKDNNLQNSTPANINTLAGSNKVLSIARKID